MKSNQKNIAILGASPKSDRYANMTRKLLMEKGYNVYPINPFHEHIENVRCFKTVKDITDEIDTITVYMNPARLEPVLSDIISIKPKRIILNPGTESEEIKSTLESHGISVLEACTLVLLKTNQF